MMNKTLTMINLLLITAASLLITLSTGTTNNQRNVANAPYTPLPATVREQVKTIYDSQIGVREATGHNDGPQVEAYLHYTGLGKGNAWCAAFICWVLGEAGVENPKTAWAASLFPKNRLVWPREKLRTTGNSQLTTIKGSRATNNQQLTTKKACVFGLYFPSLKRIAHCGFIDEWGEKEVITVEGNTNDSGSREGDGVYRKRRPIKSLYAVADWIGGPAK